MDSETVSQNLESKCDTCSERCGKLEVFDWLSDLPGGINTTDVVEVQFKNTRKGFFRNSNGLMLNRGDMVAVEALPGHDIGQITLTGELVLLQLKKNNINPSTYGFRRVYRRAKSADIEKWREARNQEHETMLESRRIADRLKLNMKIGDVEYQGDRTKAIFYYIADERVDFRELIKVLADRFKIRIEMRQIGARQEAGRIGGIGPCGRELCCSTWITNFKSVTTNAARYQELSLNPQKLAGQCGKLKCCLNYELDTYIDAQRDFPKTNIPLEAEDGSYYHFKTDIFKRLMWYCLGRENTGNMVILTVDRVKEVIRLNKQGEKPGPLTQEKPVQEVRELDYAKVVGEDSITRFDEKNKRSNKRRKNKRRKNQNMPGDGNKIPRARKNRRDEDDAKKR